MPSDPGPAPAATGPEHRLHPASFLFVLLAQLRQFLVPLAVVAFVGARNEEGWQLLAVALGTGGLVLAALARYFTFRYAIGGDGIVLRSGVLQRNVRHIPFARIHNVGLHQSLVHRLFGVAEVRLESASGTRPEAEMRVLRVADAQALEDLVRHAARVPAGATAAAPAAIPPARVLLALDAGELLRLGLISNRGMVVVAAGFGVLAQSGSDLLADALEDWSTALFGYADQLQLGWVATAVAASGLIVAAMAVLRLLSVVLAVLTYHGFTLTERAGRLQVQRGLLTRVRASVPRHRIQAFAVGESLLQRLFGRRALRVDTAVRTSGNDARGLRELAPIARPQVVDDLVRDLLPGTAWPDLQWRRLDRRAWRRVVVVPGWLILGLSALAVARFGAWGALGLVLLPLVVVRARLWARHARYAVGERLVAVREGWLHRRWRFAEIGKLQGLRLSQSPFDRRLGMATLWLDTAGAALAELPLRIRYLPLAEAEALQRRLGGEIARRRLQW